MSRDTNFYYSFLVLPPRKRRAIVAVWDFCRAVDDAVDEAPSEGGWTSEIHARAASELAGWRSELAAVYSGTPQTKQGIALQPYAREFDLPRARFDELIDGVEMDLLHARYETFASLLEYCRRVASGVGLICLEIFGYQNKASRAYAESLGVALQLTNIIRDVASDARNGRVYLPAEDLERYGVVEADLQGGLTPPVADLLRFECDRARGYYRRAAEQLPPEDARSLLAARIMGEIYFAILQRIEQRGYDVFSERIRVPRPRRALIALRAWMGASIGLRP